MSYYEVPKWAGIPPTGFHLDVMKESKLFQKLMIDEKRCYLFGRNLDLTDFCIDHASCSRVHAALVYHKTLERFFLVDLGSTHGSFIGNIRIEANKPTQMPIDSQFHFGASTRIYVLREKPKEKTNEDDIALTLPESEYEIDNLTEFNTAHNRRISMLGVSETDDIKPAMVRKRKSVAFNEEEIVINPEDIDPTVGKFRNLVRTSIIPSGNHSSSASKRFRSDTSLYSSLFNNSLGRFNSISSSSSLSSNSSSQSSTLALPIGLLQKSSLGIHLPNPAPNIEDEDHRIEDDDNKTRKKSSSETNETTDSMQRPTTTNDESITLYDPDDMMPIENDESRKTKKYAKEAWPGHGKNMPLSNF